MKLAKPIHRYPIRSVKVGATLLALVELPLTDTHPWWACHCDDCAAARAAFSDTVTVADLSAASHSLIEKLIEPADAWKVIGEL